MKFALQDCDRLSEPRYFSPYNINIGISSNQIQSYN